MSMTYTIDELFAAAEQEIEAWKSDAQKGYKSNDYMYLGFLRAVADRLQSNSQNSGKPDVVRSDNVGEDDYYSKNSISSVSGVGIQKP